MPFVLPLTLEGSMKEMLLLLFFCDSVIKIFILNDLSDVLICCIMRTVTPGLHP